MEGKIQPGQEKATSKEEIKKRAPLSLTRAISERNLCSLARDKVRILFVTSNQPPVTSSNSKRNNETLIARFKGHIAAVACILCFFFLSLEMPQLFLTLYVYDHTTGKKTGSRPITEVKPCRARLVLRWVTTWEPLVL